MRSQPLTYTIDDVLAALQHRVQAAGTLTAAAKEIGITKAYLSDILLRRRHPGPRVLHALRLRKVPRPKETPQYTRAAKAR